MRGCLRVACSSLVAVLLLAVAASARTSAPPSAPKQSLRDGCQRAPLNLLLLKSSEWVYVYRDPSIRVAE
jgi:hypothetical protein